jgi:hypothetical protein
MSLNTSKNIETFLLEELSLKHKTLRHVIIITQHAFDLCK